MIIYYADIGMWDRAIFYSNIERKLDDNSLCDESEEFL